MHRREFLKKFIKSFFGILFTVVVSLVFVFLYPKKLRKKEVRFFEIMKEEDLPKRGVKNVKFQITRNNRTINMRVFFVNHEGKVFALSPVCTHLGCLVNWHRGKKQFLCPCHGGKYDIQGRVIGGPPPRPLTRLPFKVQNERVYIGLKV